MKWQIALQTKLLIDSAMLDFLEADSEEAALEQLHELDCTDGLPVVVPTEERV